MSEIVILARDWMGFLRARADGAVFTVPIGKVDRPPLPVDRSRVAPGYATAVTGTAWLVAFGRIRGRAPILALENGVGGFTVQLDAARFESLTVDVAVPWFRGWHEPSWAKEAPKPFAAWAWAGLAGADVERAIALGALTPKAAPAAAPAPAPAASSSTARRAPAATKARASKAWEAGGDAPAPAAAPAPCTPPIPGQGSLF